LNETLFTSLANARHLLAHWLNDFNTIRPHSAIGNLPPALYAQLSAPDKQRHERLSQTRVSRPMPLHHRAAKAQMTVRLYSTLDDDRGSDEPCS
jgi:hypothetical protein